MRFYCIHRLSYFNTKNAQNIWEYLNITKCNVVSASAAVAHLISVDHSHPVDNKAVGELWDVLQRRIA